ncbi:MAG: DUF3429 domain-containing protein [Rhodovarius sp.]|nr:DUF3429 domain-containing protein [Rhodovarius sp.]MDW8315602.1 DUF3429 domain-containing protein [Rhodovarius sp.]
MRPALPPLAWPLGLLGLIPFLAGAGALAIGMGWAGFPLAAYGATILSFLGAVHWGLALAEPERAARERLGFGVVPSLWAWLALLLPVPLALPVLAAGILATAGAETLAAQRGLLPGAYLRLRWVLSVVAAAALFAGAMFAPHPA